VPFYAAVTGLTTLSYLILGIIVYVNNPKRELSRKFLIFCSCVAFWAFGYFITLLPFINYQTALISSRISHAVGAFIPIAFLHFTLIFLERKGAYRRVLTLGYWISFGMFFACFTPLVVKSLFTKMGIAHYPESGLLYPVYVALYVVFAVCYSQFETFRSLFRLQGTHRTRLIVFIISTAVGFVGGISLFLLIFNFPIPPYASVLIIVFPPAMAFTIIKYREFDIEIAITRTGIFVLVYCAVIGIPLWMVIWGRNWLEAHLGRFWWVLPQTFFTAMALIGPFIYLRLRDKAEAVLLREQRAYQQTLLQASKGMTLIKELDRLLNLVAHILTKAVRMKHVHIFLGDNTSKEFHCKASRGGLLEERDKPIPETAAIIRQMNDTKKPLVLEELQMQGTVPTGGDAVSEMQKLKADLVIPSFVQDRLLGFLLIGKKRSNRGYTETDIDTLSTLANQAALAIENCIFLIEFEQQQAHFFQVAKMADLGTMASGIAHQVNNRFHVIKLGVDCATMVELHKLTQYIESKNADWEVLKKISEGLQQTCHKVSESAQHGSEIVKRLLNFSKLSEGFVLMDVKDAMESSVRLWECKQQLDKIGFHMSGAKDLLKIKGNFSEVEEILFNLLDNAADAIRMKEEAFSLGKLEKPVDWVKGTIRLESKNAELNGKPHVMISVSEDGIGMDEETKKKIFVPFFTTKATAIKGTGLGLYVIRKMVDAHQGRIKIESEYGRGTTFHVYLPAPAE